MKKKMLVLLLALGMAVVSGVEGCPVCEKLTQEEKWDELELHLQHDHNGIDTYELWDPNGGKG